MQDLSFKQITLKKKKNLKHSYLSTKPDSQEAKVWVLFSAHTSPLRAIQTYPFN